MTTESKPTADEKPKRSHKKKPSGPPPQEPCTVAVGDGDPIGIRALDQNDVLEIPEAGLTLEFSEGQFIDVPYIDRADDESVESFKARVLAHIGAPLPTSPGTYQAIHQTTGNGWSLVNGDSCEVVKSIPTDSVDLSIYSPPFASLYTYSNSDRDMGNCADHDEFHAHFRFLLAEMLRITKPGRNMCVHCMDLPTSKTRDGEIGLTDFPGEIIRSCREIGWIWHSKATIWKDPVTAMQRTKALGLLHKQIKKDSCMSRMGIPDYVLTFRKPGVNPEPVSHTDETFPVSMWQKWASPVWDDIDPSDTLQHRSAREEEDERHICPLQLEVIRRCVRLWSNADDVVFSPFAGIGSEGFVALEESRRFVGCELKPSYYEQAVKNLATAEPNASGKQITIFDMLGGGK